MQIMLWSRALRIPMLSVVCGMAIFISACGGERVNDAIVVSQASLDVALEDAVDARIITAVNGFVLAVTNLDDAVEAFCVAPDVPSLVELQQEWRNTAEAWYRLEPYNFGPLNDDIVFPTYTFIDAYRLRGTDYTATVRTEIANDMAGTYTLNDSYFGSKTFQRVGLLALEVAIFETSSAQSQASADIVTEYAASTRKCEMLHGLTAQLLQRANYVKNGWSVDYKNTGQAYRTIFLSGELEDGSESVSAMLVAIQEYLDYLKLRSVVTSTAQISAYSWELIAASIDEIENLLVGQTDARFTFFSIMQSAGKVASVETVEANIASIRTNISSRDADGLGAVLALLDGNFKREIPDGLDVDLKITFTDGD